MRYSYPRWSDRWRGARLVGRTAAIFLLFVLSAVAGEASKQQAWISLFNGRDFAGWQTYLDGPGKNQDPDHVFQIHDGVLHLYKDHTDATAAPKGYLATEREYSCYDLRFQYKWGTKKFRPR